MVRRAAIRAIVSETHGVTHRLDTATDRDRKIVDNLGALLGRGALIILPKRALTALCTFAIDGLSL
jgi:hypothetical protein